MGKPYIPYIEEREMYDHWGIKGAQRIVLEELVRLKAEGRRVSIVALADATGYSHKTTWRVVRELCEQGLIEVDHPYNGGRATYTIKGGSMSILSSIVHLFTMSGSERAARFAAALASNALYEDARLLRRMARRLGGEFQEQAEVFIEENGLLEIAKVWHDTDDLQRLGHQIAELLTMGEEMSK
jgi:phage-related protein